MSGHSPAGSTPEPDRAPVSRRRLAQQMALPLRRFMATESGSAGLLLLATIAALIWANSAWSESYADLWSTELLVRLGDMSLDLDLRHWVNDGLMVFFFFVAGLEIRRETAMGEMSDWRRLRIPLLAALTGILVPAAIFLSLNPSGPAAQGWGVAISTDTAFVLGVLAVAGSVVPTQLRIFLLTMSVVDDVAALVIIALFYSNDVALAPLLVAALCVVVILALGRLRVWRGPAYFVVGAVLWLAMLESGVHPAIAGVLIALCIPVYPPRRAEVERAAGLAGRFRQSPMPSLARTVKLSVERAVSPNERMQELLHPWSSYVIVPIFALANAGMPLGWAELERALTSPLGLGIILGLVVGKLLGVGVATLVMSRLGLGALPRGASRFDILAGGVMTGIGFTVSLFIVELAFTDRDLADQAKLGVLVGSASAAVLGLLLFRISAMWAASRGKDNGAPRLDPPVDPTVDHIRGPHDAPLTLVEYADFECPFCSRTTGIIDELHERFGDRLRYVFRHLPLIDVHSRAERAACASEVAGLQGRFWEMHDRLYAHQDRLEHDDLLEHAAAIGLDVERFADDMEAGLGERRVHDDVAAAEASGVSGTPTFFIGGRRHSGVYDTETLARRLLEAGAAEAELAEAAAGERPVT